MTDVTQWYLTPMRLSSPHFIAYFKNNNLQSSQVTIVCVTCPHMFISLWVSSLSLELPEVGFVCHFLVHSSCKFLLKTCQRNVYQTGEDSGICLSNRIYWSYLSVMSSGIPPSASLTASPSVLRTRKIRAISWQIHFYRRWQRFIELQYKRSLKVTEHSGMFVY